MRVSVLMPSFNQARYIERAVRSVLDQDYPCLDLIIMDGGSTDETLLILQRLSQHYGERLYWESAQDRGPAHALNKALAQAHGGLIGWLNSDDAYELGAVRRAVDYFSQHPDCWMLYGEGQHIDADGCLLGRYPTRLPATGLSGFADGCYICQPTVFLKRATLQMLKGFDESQRTTFDMELWMRLFSRHGQRIGYVDAVQANSRLHDDCITLTQRARVIRESMTLLARHLGQVPMHWFQTYAEELWRSFPLGDFQGDLLPHLDEFLTSVAPMLGSDGVRQGRQWLHNNRQFRLCTAGGCLVVDPDGWLTEHSELRLAANPQPWRRLELIGYHSGESGQPLNLMISLQDGTSLHCPIDSVGAFRVELDLPLISKCCVLPIRASGCFVPSLIDPESTDNRALACRLDAMSLSS